MLDIMLDLETMDTRPTAAIVAIGACGFDRHAGCCGEQIYLPVALESSLRHGCTIVAGTILWWMEQDDAARRELSRSDRLPLPQALEQLAAWLRWQSHPDELALWGNGAGFDNVILRHAYTRVGMAPPWHWWNDRCYRTLKTEHPEMPAHGFRFGVAHHAGHDAHSQAAHAAEILAAGGGHL